MKHVLFVSQTLEYGGTEKHVEELVLRLQENARCTIVCLAGDLYSQSLAGRSHVRVIQHPQINKNRFWRYWVLFRKYKPDVVVFVKGIPDLFPTVAYVAARLAGVGRVVAIEQLISDLLPPVSRDQGPIGAVQRYVGWRARYVWDKKIQSRLCQATICVSESIRRLLIDDQGYDPKRTITIHNGANLRHFGTFAGATGDRERDPLKNGKTSLVCVARLSKPKRIDLLIDALFLLLKSQRNWRCVIVGGGPQEQELRTQVTKLGLDEFIRFEGHVNDVRPYLGQADLLVLSSDKEGLPLAIAEAMAMGLPCIATDVGGTREIVIHGQTGLLVKPGSADDLCRAMDFLIVQEAERRRMALAAKEWAYEHFDLEKIMAKVKAVVLG